MHVLHVITGLNNGGAEAVLFRLVESGERYGDRHCVISLTDGGIYAERLEKIGVTVHVLGFPRGRVTLGGLIKLLRLFRGIKPNVVQTWMYHADLIGGVAARICGFRAIVWGLRHANLDPRHNSQTTLVVARVCAFFSKFVPRKIVSCSLQATLVHQALGYRADKFVYIPNGYNMNRFRIDVPGRSNIRIEVGVADDVFLLGMVARFDPQKDHRNLIDALCKLKNENVRFNCLLVGVGMDQANDLLHRWIEDAGLSTYIKLLGARSDIPAVMNALDVHVLSSLGEAFPNVLAEAMACGTPCVTTDVGDAASIVGDHGWVVAPQDAGALAMGLMQAHVSFRTNTLEWRNRQIACRSHILANFELDQMCNEYRKIWRACIGVQVG